ncbi:MAG: hypothetical protein QMC67_06700 [Candidatus Wallbacteria bacterium]
MKSKIDGIIKYMPLKTADNKNIDYYEFEYHRFSLWAWYRAMRKNSGIPPYVITIDRHRDLTRADENSIQKFASFLNDDNLFDNIEKYPAAGNYDFIDYALRCNFFSNMLAVTYENYHDIEIRSMLPANQFVKDNFGNMHHITVIESLNSAFAKNCDFSVREVYKTGFELLNNAQNIIIDIDLDYFTYQSPDNGVFVRDCNDIENNFSLIKDNLRDIVKKKVSTVVIARESECCGGSENAGRIKKMLSRLFMENFNITIPAD